MVVYTITSMEKFVVATGVKVPFYPVVPTPGRTLRAERLVDELYEEMRKPDVWLAQPILAGERAVLSVIDKKVRLHGASGKWLHPKFDTSAFKKLPDKTVLDGIIFEDDFHAFDIVALDGRSMIFRTASEREAVTYQMVRLVKHRWMFERPTKKWMLARGKNSPAFTGVVLKSAKSYYVIGSEPDQKTLHWFSRKW